MLQPLCVCDKEHVVFPPFTPPHQGLVPNFVAILKIKDKQKHSRPLLLLQFKEVEWRSRVTERGMKRGKALGRGRRAFEYRPRQGCQKGRRRRKEVNEKRVDLAEMFSSDLKWVYVFTQPANNSVQGAWPYSIHHTHTIKWKGMRCQFQLELILKVWMNLIRHSSKLSIVGCVGWCYTNSCRKIEA